MGVGGMAGQDTLGFFIPGEMHWSSLHLLAWVKVSNAFLNTFDSPPHPPKGHILLSCQDRYPRGVNTTELDTDQLGKEFTGKAILPSMVSVKRRGHVTEGRQGSFISRVTTGIQQIA